MAISDHILVKKVSLHMYNPGLKRMTARMFWEVYSQTDKEGFLVVEQWGWERGKGRVIYGRGVSQIGDYIRDRIEKKTNLPLQQRGFETKEYKVTAEDTISITADQFVIDWEQSFAKAEPGGPGDQGHAVRAGIIERFRRGYGKSEVALSVGDDIVNYMAGSKSPVSDVTIKAVEPAVIEPAYTNWGGWA